MHPWSSLYRHTRNVMTMMMTPAQCAWHTIIDRQWPSDDCIRCRDRTTRSFAIAKRTARQSCLVDLVHCQHCFLRHGLDIPDFSNWCLSRAPWSSIGHISAFWQGTSHRCFSIMPSFSVTSANIAISIYRWKLDSLGYISVAESLGVSSTIFT